MTGLPRPSLVELENFVADARRFARTASRDDQVVEGAASHAVAQLDRYWDTVTPNAASRKAWLKIVAVNAARRQGAALHVDIPFGRGGSELPDTDDPEADERAAGLIAEMHLGAGSLGATAIDHKLTDAKRAARLLLEDLLNDDGS